jgi:3-oxoacyl-[acyl-carrier-protein] synthase III
LNELSANAAKIIGWGEALGTVRVAAAEVEREFSLAAGKLSERAGIESVVRAGGGEDEVTLAFSAAQAALRRAGVNIGSLDSIIATSETFLAYPSLGARLHTRLPARPTCGVLDVGGACLGLLNGFSTAQCLLETGRAKTILVVTADVHSQLLAPGRMPGEFAGLFGDGASAFVLGGASESDSAHRYRLGEFQFGCAASFSSAIVIGFGAHQEIALQFEGKALARAAVGSLERIISDLEMRSGVKRGAVAGFATHQPNPRLMELFARQAGVPIEKFPLIAKTCGNLGSSTCGAALSFLLTEQARRGARLHRPIFLASLGPGLLWGGGVLY